MDEERIVHLLSWHQVQNEAQLGQALEQVKQAGLMPEDHVRLCVVCDGASWIWKHIKSLFPSARQVLDYYHLSGCEFYNSPQPLVVSRVVSFSSVYHPTSQEVLA